MQTGATIAASVLSQAAISTMTVGLPIASVRRDAASRVHSRLRGASVNR